MCLCVCVCVRVYVCVCTCVCVCVCVLCAGSTWPRTTSTPRSLAALIWPRGCWPPADRCRKFTPSGRSHSPLSAPPHCTALHRTVLHCTAPHRTAPPHRTALYCTVLCWSLLYLSIRCSLSSSPSPPLPLPLPLRLSLSASYFDFVCADENTGLVFFASVFRKSWI